MSIRKSAKSVLIGLVVLALSGVLAGQQGASAQGRPAKELREVAVGYTSPTSGAAMYKSYCAACHGAQGRGDGPAVEFLKAPPPDLRTLARRNHGKYPADHVAMALRLGTGSHAHGTIDMPLWGPLFRTVDANQTVGELRIHNLNMFVESLQKN